MFCVSSQQQPPPPPAVGRGKPTTGRGSNLNNGSKTGAMRLATSSAAQSIGRVSARRVRSDNQQEVWRSRSGISPVYHHWDGLLPRGAHDRRKACATARPLAKALLEERFLPKGSKNLFSNGILCSATYPAFAAPTATQGTSVLFSVLSKSVESWCRDEDGQHEGAPSLTWFNRQQRGAQNVRTSSVPQNRDSLPLSRLCELATKHALFFSALSKSVKSWCRGGKTPRLGWHLPSNACGSPVLRQPNR